ncbi:MAG: hypothetical protein AAFO07_20435 [Bacteroidota bacterium]
MENCLYDEQLEDSAYTTEHELIYILSGELLVEKNVQKIQLRAGEAGIAKRGTYFHFQKSASKVNRRYESILFFIKEKLVNDFIKYYDLKTNVVRTVDNPLIKGFVESLTPYFDQPIIGKKELFRLKTFELQTLFR